MTTELQTKDTLTLAAVRILRAPYAIDRDFDYLVPDYLCARIHRGSLVVVPFGVKNRRETAVCTSLRQVTSNEAPPRLKSILELMSDDYDTSEEQFALCEFLSRHTLCTMGEAVYTVVPTSVRRGHENIRYRRYISVPKKQSGIKMNIEELLACARASGKVTPAQERVLEAISRAEHPLRPDELCQRAQVSESVIQNLVLRGALNESKEEEIRDPYAELRGGEKHASPIVLTTAQTKAYESALSLYEQKKATAGLLFGVTGSGKTKVILKLIDRVLADGKSAIMMVPEIALTPQTVRIFYERYGECAAVVHSQLSEGERFDTWRRCSSGKIRVVIGTRSAVFAPMRELGLIVIDEEHEHTYKSERNPKYHARDVAAFRAGQGGFPVIFASATPAIESFYKAERGTYTLIPLRERFGGLPMPETELVDMRAELTAGHRSPLSRRLLEALTDVVERGEQAILFLNRRGYSTALQCKKCGEVPTCPHCSLSLTYHTGENRGLLCHSCGYRTDVPRVCPSCSASELSHVGFGTEKIETDIATYLPNARVLRMDADTTATKGSFERILTSFRNGEADILLGTQMVTKGHDFPRVSLVGVVLADTSLYAADFRAAEKTFSLLTQVIGRAGRAGAGGRAIVQSFTPRHELLQLSCKQDYEAFYRRESAIRRAAEFPPFCDMVYMTFISEDETAVARGATNLLAQMVESAKKDYADLPMTFYGPFEAPIYRENDRYRLNIIVKCRLNSRARRFFTEMLSLALEDKKVTISIDAR